MNMPATISVNAPARRESNSSSGGGSAGKLLLYGEMTAYSALEKKVIYCSLRRERHTQTVWYLGYPA